MVYLSLNFGYRNVGTFYWASLCSKSKLLSSEPFKSYNCKMASHRQDKVHATDGDLWSRNTFSPVAPPTIIHSFVLQPYSVFFFFFICFLSGFPIVPLLLFQTFVLDFLFVYNSLPLSLSFSSWLLCIHQILASVSLINIPIHICILVIHIIDMLSTILQY